MQQLGARVMGPWPSFKSAAVNLDSFEIDHCVARNHHLPIRASKHALSHLLVAATFTFFLRLGHGDCLRSHAVVVRSAVSSGTDSQLAHLHVSSAYNDPGVARVGLGRADLNAVGVVKVMCAGRVHPLAVHLVQIANVPLVNQLRTSRTKSWRDSSLPDDSLWNVAACRPPDERADGKITRVGVEDEE